MAPVRGAQPALLETQMGFMRGGGAQSLL